MSKPILKSRLPEIAAGLDSFMREGMKLGGEAIAESAKARVPVDSGELRAAIHVDEGTEGVYVVAGDKDAFYGHLVEHGTSHSAPQPFLIPAFEENAELVNKLAGKSMRHGIAEFAIKRL